MVGSTEAHRPETTSPSRRAARAAEPTRGPRRPRPAAPSRAVATTTAPRRSVARVVLSALVMTIAAGLVATLALPSYATKQDAPAAAAAPDGEQRYAAGADVAEAEFGRDAFKATSSATLLRRTYAQRFAAYTGPSAEDFLKNPAKPDFSLDAVYTTGLQYRGVPYVFGGADPSGFDCSGFIMFVYAQYGIALPHSVHSQDLIGTPIAPADAQPGDVVIFNDDSHDGFYAGDGRILHAPYPGASVRVQKLWTADVHYVRFGI